MLKTNKRDVLFFIFRFISVQTFAKDKEALSLKVI